MDVEEADILDEAPDFEDCTSGVTGGSQGSKPPVVSTQ
jgi:hypothetical protein